MKNEWQPSSLSTLPFARAGRRLRISSYDRTGGNDDRIYVKPGARHQFATIEGAGSISHIWCTLANKGVGEQEDNMLRKVVLRAYWDGESHPSVEVPIGDFFGMGHAQCRNFSSEPLQMSPEDGKSFNSWFPMPFSNGAVLEVENECDTTLVFYFYVDFEALDSLSHEVFRFHATWNRECPTDGIPSRDGGNEEWLFQGKNTTGDGNYVILEAEGQGHYVGTNINIHNLRDSAKWDWPGEGDDMIFVDGEQWPPQIHGTGTEDYVNMAWCPTQEYSAPYHGLILGGRDNWKGKISYYRYHILDPITFAKSIRVTIEHGHNNNRSDDWSSTAYWYQTEPHKAFGKLPPVQDRLPIAEGEFFENSDND